MLTLNSLGHTKQLDGWLKVVLYFGLTLLGSFLFSLITKPDDKYEELVLKHMLPALYEGWALFFLIDYYGTR